MNKLEIKKEILSECIKKNQLTVDDFQNLIKELRESDNSTHEESPDLEDQSHSEENTDSINRLTNQINAANEKMVVLNNLSHDKEQHTNASLGAVVETDKETFFVSVDTGKFKIYSKEVLCISEKSPLYKALDGKKKGDAFDFDGRKYSIKDIY